MKINMQDFESQFDINENERINQEKKLPDSIELPTIIGSQLIIFPGLSASFDIKRDSHKMAFQKASETESYMFLATIKSNIKDLKTSEDLHNVGTIVKITQVSELAAGDGYNITVEGVSRAYAEVIKNGNPFLIIRANKIPTKIDKNESMTKAYKKILLKLIKKYGEATGKILLDINKIGDEIKSLSLLTDMMASSIPMSFNQKNKLLQVSDEFERAKYMKEFLEEEIKITKYEASILDNVRRSMEEHQKEYFLREQLKAIRGELGDGVDISQEADKFLEQLNKLELKPDTKTKLEKEIRRLSLHQPGSPEIAQIRNYLDLVFDLPWGKTTKDNLSISKARKILDKDHYGMEKVKERIIEFIAVRKLKSKSDILSIKGPILCLVGPPGVGKTSIAKSLANALNREYVRMSLGGVHDESEIRGHRRTYIGSMPGRFINAIRQAKTDNPLILLDEVDKLGKDFRGDPSSALLEVLDPEQNNAFRDNYLEVTYDLSKVLFITTANNWDSIPPALLDRMEIVELSGYTREEKEEIAMRHIIPKQLKENGIERKNLKITRAAIKDVIENYTSEAGVRQLERSISKICRKAAIKFIENKEENISVNKNNCEEFLGQKRKSDNFPLVEDMVGMVNGLAWTSVGGKILPIEVSISKGKGSIELTGQLGDVMKESAKLALSYVKSNASKLGLEDLFYENIDIHIHVPAGATPKEGPSAGVALTMALISAFTGKAINSKFAMTGEITLRGNVLVVGGVKEKLLAAARYKVQKAFIPYENLTDTKELPDSVKQSLEIVPVKTIDEIIKETIA